MNMKNFAMGNNGQMANLMKQAEAMQKQLEKTKAELAETAVEATVGGGMVTASMSGASINDVFFGFSICLLASSYYYNTEKLKETNLKISKRKL